MPRQSRRFAPLYPSKSFADGRIKEAAWHFCFGIRLHEERLSKPSQKILDSEPGDGIGCDTSLERIATPSLKDDLSSETEEECTIRAIHLTITGLAAVLGNSV